MTNHIFLTEIDGEVVELDYLLEVRHGHKEVKEIIESEGIEEAAKHVCWYCGNYVPEEEQDDHYHPHMDKEFQPENHHAPI